MRNYPSSPGDLTVQQYRDLIDSDRFATGYRWIFRGAIAVFLMLALSIGGCSVVGPQVKLYKVNTEKKALIGEAKARSDAAKYEAEREIEISEAEAEAARIKAKGVADSNATIAQSLTPEYIRWLYVDQMDDIARNSENTVIYVPQDFQVTATADVVTGK